VLEGIRNPRVVGQRAGSKRSLRHGRTWVCSSLPQGTLIESGQLDISRHREWKSRPKCINLLIASWIAHLSVHAAFDGLQAFFLRPAQPFMVCGSKRSFSLMLRSPVATQRDCSRV
jgi:hypothetical protein